MVSVSLSKRGGFFHTFNAGTIAVQRTVTDESGSFFVPGWPKVWRFPDSLLKTEFIDSDQPTVYMLKAGYKPWFGWNERPQNKEDKESRDEGKIERYIQEPLTLTSLSGTEEDMYYKFKRSFISVRNFIPDVTFCGDFDEFKLALLEVDKQEHRAERAGVDGRDLRSWLYPETREYRKPCTNIAEWLKSQREEKKEFYEKF